MLHWFEADNISYAWWHPVSAVINTHWKKKNIKLLFSKQTLSQVPYLTVLFQQEQMCPHVTDIDIAEMLQLLVVVFSMSFWCACTFLNKWSVHFYVDFADVPL